MSCPNLSFNTHSALLQQHVTSNAVCQRYTNRGACLGTEAAKARALDHNPASLLFAETVLTKDADGQVLGTDHGYDPCEWDDAQGCVLPDRSTLLGSTGNSVCAMLDGFRDDTDATCTLPATYDAYVPCLQQCARHVGFVNGVREPCITAAGLDTSAQCMNTFDQWFSRCMDTSGPALCVVANGAGTIVPGDNASCQKTCATRVRSDNPDSESHCVAAYCDPTCDKMYPETP